MPPTDPAMRPKAKPAEKPTRPRVPDLETYVEPGDFVSWFPGADRGERPQLALVTERLLDTKVTCSVVHPHLQYVLSQDGAYHMDNPRAAVDNSAGGWRHRPHTVAVRRMLITLGILVWDAAGENLVLADPPPAPAPAGTEVVPPTRPAA